MIKKNCIVCGGKKKEIIWNDKIRAGTNTFTKKKEIIYKCAKCELVFLKNKRKFLENSSMARAIYNKDSSIKEFLSFHKPREIQKLKFIKKHLKFKNKKILESNCGAGVLLSALKREAKSTTGLDSIDYKNFIVKSGHLYYESLPKMIKKKKMFDLIFCLSELEHKIDPIKFLKSLSKILAKSGRLVLRIPNFNNIYRYTLGYSFYKFDYRTSHNYYFSRKNLDILFKNLNFSAEKILGYHEYDLNHLTACIKLKRRVGKKYDRVFSEKESDFFVKNIENALSSTSLVYILKRI